MFIYEGGISEQKSGGKFKTFVFKPHEHDKDIFLKKKAFWEGKEEESLMELAKWPSLPQSPTSSYPSLQSQPLVLPLACNAQRCPNIFKKMWHSLESTTQITVVVFFLL